MQIGALQLTCMCQVRHFTESCALSGMHSSNCYRDRGGQHPLGNKAVFSAHLLDAKRERGALARSCVCEGQRDRVWA